MERVVSTGIARCGTAGRPPARAAHVLDGTRVALERGVLTPRPPAHWAWRFPDEPYTVAFDGWGWELSPGLDPNADVVVDTAPRRWAEFVIARRDVPPTGAVLQLHGEPIQFRQFATVFGITFAA